jgi:hypothetical protein
MEITLVMSEAEAIALVNVLGQNSPAKSGQDIYSVFVALDSALDNNWLSPHIPKP